MVIKLSHSQVNTFSTFCSYSWYLERRAGKHSRPHGSTIAGSAFHNIAEAVLLTEHGKPTPIPTPEEAFDAAMRDELARSDEWTEGDIRWSKANRSKTWPEGQNKAWLLHHLPGWIQGWQAWRRAVPWDLHVFDDGTPAVEVPFEMILPGNVADRGYIDAVYRHRVTGEYGVVDWKAGSKEPSGPDQLGGYSVALDDQYGIKATWGAFFMARKSTTSQVYDLTRFDMGRLAWQFNHVADRVENLDVLPNMNSCNACGLKRWCVFAEGEDADQVTPPWKLEQPDAA